MQSIQHQIERCLSEGPRSIEQLYLYRDLLSTLQSLHLGQTEVMAEFEDPAYWETLSDGLHVTDNQPAALDQCRKSRKAAVGDDEEEDAAALHELLNEQGFVVLPPLLCHPGNSSSLLFARLQQTVLNLRAAGWPPVFIFLYDEFWIEVVDPLFDVCERLLGKGCSMASDLNCWCLRAPEAAQGTYIGQNFGEPHRDMAYRKCFSPDVQTGEPSVACLNAWVPINPVGANARNGAMRVMPRQADPHFADQHHQGYKMRDTCCLSSPAAKCIEAVAGSAVMWLPCVMHWGGSCESPDLEPRISIAAAVFRPGQAKTYGPEGYMPVNHDQGPVAPGSRPITRSDLASISLSRRISCAAQALLSFAHWHPGFPTWLTLADELHKVGSLESALDAYECSLARIPNDEEAHTSRGHVLLELGRSRDAVEAFEAALLLEPGDEDLLAFRDNARAA